MYVKHKAELRTLIPASYFHFSILIMFVNSKFFLSSSSGIIVFSTLLKDSLHILQIKLLTLDNVITIATQIPKTKGEDNCNCILQKYFHLSFLKTVYVIFLIKIRTNNPRYCCISKMIFWIFYFHG